MNKTLRIFLFTCLTAIFCISCSKIEDIIPESYERNDKPFSVEPVPEEGGTITLEKIEKNGDEIQRILIDHNSTSLVFDVGDSLVLSANSKSGYTFINWIRDGVKVTDSNNTDISSQPVFGFKVEAKDMVTIKVKVGNSEVDRKVFNHHFEARFGLDYAIQSIPSIDEVIPADLIAAMGEYLQFGDTPPRIDTCFSAIDFITLDTLIQNDPSEAYSFSEQPQTFPYPKNTFLFENQHRCIVEKHYYERCNYPDYFYYSADAADSIFVMGHDNCFTVYFKQTWKAWIHPDLAGLDNLRNVTRRESIILCGKICPEGITDFHWGMCVESYNPSNYQYIGADPGHSGQPGIHDIMIFSYKDSEGNNLVLPYDPTFQKHQ